MVNSRTAALLAEGQSIWQDDISRGQLTGGHLQRMVDEVGIRGVTSNPTIFEKAISSGSDYDEQIAGLLSDGKTALEIFEAVEVDDIRAACDVLLPVYNAGNGVDGYVSIEVSPDAARDANSTREQVRRLWDAVDRPNLMVKIPGTVEGIPVVQEMLAEGKNINITLLFGLDAYRNVANAYVSALEERHAKGLPIDRIASVASFFVSRVDTLIGPHTVNTMPGKTIEAFLDHGTVTRTVDADFEGAWNNVAALNAAGIDLKAVTDQLEDEGIASFIKSFETLLEGVESKRAALAGVTS